MHFKNLTLLVAASLLMGLACRRQDIPVIREGQLQPERFRYQFTSIGHDERLNSIRPVFNYDDLNNDGLYELIEVNNTELDQQAMGSYLQVWQDFTTLLARMDFDGPIGYLGTEDLYNDGRCELIVSEFRNDSVFVYILLYRDQTLTIDHCFTAVEKPETLLFPQYGWFSGVDYHGCIDANNDGSPDLIFSVATPKPYIPRGIFIYDLANEKKLWSHDGGYAVTRIVTADVNGDGMDEIIAGTSAPGNSEGHVVRGTDDNHSYLIVLDSRTGNPVGNYRQLGEIGTAVFPYIAALDNDETPCCFICMRPFVAGSAGSYIQFLDTKNNVLKRQLTLRNNTISGNVAFFDGDDDGDADLVYGWSDGLLEISEYNPAADRLTRIAALEVPGMEHHRIYAGDFIGDGTRQLLCFGDISGRYYTLLLSRKLELLAVSNEIISIGDLGWTPGREGRRESFMSRQKNYTDIIALKKRSIWQFFQAWLARNTHISFAVLAVLLAVSVVMALQERTKKSKLLTAALQAHQSPAFITNKAGDILRANHLLYDFASKGTKQGKQTVASLFSEECWDECRIWLLQVLAGNATQAEKEFSILIDEEAKEFLVRVFPLRLSLARDNLMLVRMQELTEILQSKRALAWASMAQRLAHEIKTPLATVMLSAQRLGAEYEKSDQDLAVLRKYIDRILEQVERLRAMTDATLKFARVEKPQLEKTDVNRLIETWIDANRSRISRDIELETSFAHDLPLLMLDKQQVSIVLQNLVDNSLNAISGAGVITIATRTVQSLHNGNASAPRQTVEIEISDTGRGIRRDQMKDLFKPFFSTSQGGTGLGLVIVKKIIEDHKGRIAINSDVQIGTTVVLSFPVNGKKKNDYA
ncbi:hypothetical protein JXO52_12155 [bacterium]|nr:hypothetical protein [bacterium]